MEPRTLDGNAIGGLLQELFGVELTAAPCTCGGCGARVFHVLKVRASRMGPR